MSARVTMPISRPSSVTGSRFTLRSIISAAAAAIGRVASIVIAGEVIASPAVRASALASSWRVSADSPNRRASGR